MDKIGESLQLFKALHGGSSETKESLLSNRAANISKNKRVRKKRITGCRCTKNEGVIDDNP